MEQGQVYRERAKAYFNSKTPCHIITNGNNWVNGFIVGKPDEYFFKVWDKVDGIVKVHYCDIDTFKEFTGEVSGLPVPDEVQD